MYRNIACSSCDKYNAEKTSLQKKNEQIPITENKLKLMKKMRRIEIENEVHLKKVEKLYARKRQARKKEDIAAKGSEEVNSFPHHFVFTQLDPKNMGLINKRTSADLPSHWVDEFKTARTKSAPFVVLEVDQCFIRQWKKYLVPRYILKCTFAVRPIREILVEAIHPRYVSHRATYNGSFETSVTCTASIPQIHVPGSREFLLPDKSYAEPLPITLEKWEDLQQLKPFCDSPAANDFFQYSCSQDNKKSIKKNSSPNY
ncbi:hypothetical protein NQ314_014756 [Rhamnusium bicolor]|uniref:Uncharacterized protein n=1 Tax=Rhamnusium bicolor TaxID=1586634 RepID=A0AAV8X025_9CUCU|nr:hypothetical protein NQ314_014756 [Rhamnusium bicolor]